jgi:hypothetical protein
MSKIDVLVLKQSPISAVFPIVQFAGDQKTALTRESLHTYSPRFILVFYREGGDLTQ